MKPDSQPAVADRDAAKHFFDQAALPEGNRSRLAHGRGAGLREIVLAPVQHQRDLLLGKIAGRRLLEIGAGYGDELVLLAERGAWAVGLDFAFERLRHLPYGPATAGVVGDCHCLPFREHTFELVFGDAILAHLDRERAFAEIRRVLAPGGSFLLIEPLARHPLLRFYRRRLVRRGQVAAYLDYEELDRDHLGGGRELFPVGLSSVLLLIPAALGLDGRLPRGLARLLNHLDDLLFRRSRWARRHAWVCVVKYLRR